MNVAVFLKFFLLLLCYTDVATLRVGSMACDQTNTSVQPFVMIYFDITMNKNAALTEHATPFPFF